jgi:LacI family transcriptional regulator
MGAMRALMESGYRIPDDVAIVGFNNSPKMKFLTPSLSTVDFSYNKIVEAGVSTVIHLLLGKDFDDFIEFDSEFIPRESSVIREVSDGQGS